jgi:diacylglycerol kinase (ATP)
MSGVTEQVERLICVAFNLQKAVDVIGENVLRSAAATRQHRCITKRPFMVKNHTNDQDENALSLKGKVGIARIFSAAKNSLAGLRVVWVKEAAFRQVVVLNLILLPLAFVVNVSHGERAILILVTFLTLVVELINSAVEAVVDRISLDIHPLSKQAKDMGSAAQLLSLVLVVLIWLVILF